jgi:MFS family permease
MSLAYIGLFAAGFNLFAALLLAGSAQLERLFGIRRLLLLTAVIPALLFVVVAASRHMWVLGPALFLLVGCKVVRGPVLVALINRHIESENRATVISSMSLLERGITCAIYPLVGRLADVKVGWRGGIEQVGSGRGVDLALYTLAALCAVFAFATRLSTVPVDEEARVG